MKYTTERILEVLGDLSEPAIRHFLISSWLDLFVCIVFLVASYFVIKYCRNRRDHNDIITEGAIIAIVVATVLDVIMVCFLALSISNIIEPTGGLVREIIKGLS